MKKIKFLLVFLPLFLGVIIYLLYRSKNLYYYNFIHFLNIKTKKQNSLAKKKNSKESLQQ